MITRIRRTDKTRRIFWYS